MAMQQPSAGSGAHPTSVGSSPTKACRSRPARCRICGLADRSRSGSTTLMSSARSWIASPVTCLSEIESPAPRPNARQLPSQRPTSPAFARRHDVGISRGPQYEHARMADRHLPRVWEHRAGTKDPAAVPPLPSAATASTTCVRQLRRRATSPRRRKMRAVLSQIPCT